MDIIHVLDKQVSDLIAAGEVVERPASVVKELIENSIDAGSTQIKISIENGGTTFISITDNGKGMSAKDAETAFLKHATSKITSKDDLFAIHTMGFRGEALCAISAVSKIVLTTKDHDAESGTKIVMEYGRQIEKTECAFNPGTQIIVTDLFGNTPARKKFLRSDAAETASITAILRGFAYAYPEIGFEYYADGKEKLFTFGKSDLKDAIFAVEGSEFTKSLLRIDFSSPYGTNGTKIKVSGYTGLPIYNKPKRTHQFFFVNKRLIKSLLLQNAVENAYKSHIMSGRFPICVLNINIPADEIDINVHPSKLEIKFKDENAVYDAVLVAVSMALSKNIVTPQIDYVIKAANSPIKADNDNKSEVIQASNLDAKIPHITNKNWSIIKEDDLTNLKPEQGTLNENINIVFKDIVQNDSENIEYNDCIIHKQEPANRNEISSNVEISKSEKPVTIYHDTNTSVKLFDDKSIEDYRIIGECFGTYIIIETEKSLKLIDKHALHERINFEKLKTENTHESQFLLSPILVSVDPERFDSIMKRSDLINSLGFSIDDFGDGTIAIRAIPTLISADDVVDIIIGFGNTLTKNKSAASAELIDSFLYDIACKNSIKAGKESSRAEIESLIREYMNNQILLSQCPHGRPISTEITKTGLEKMFKRIV